MWELCWSVTVLIMAMKERDGQLLQYDMLRVQEVEEEC